ncbi:MAG: metalloregulator ArsR/SmtB family transcription factor [Actinomycetota bacterium]|nr:metalloregulator ArsR/SmtB family transcription factor [Actinomycetota bacterium]
MKSESSEARLDSVFLALSSQPRRTILKRLAIGSVPMAELVDLVGLSQPAVSKHLKTLEGAGLIVRGKDRQFRPSHVELAPMVAAQEWLGGFTKAWEDRLDRLSTLLEKNADLDQGSHPPERIDVE